MRQLELRERLLVGLGAAAVAWGLIQIMDANSQSAAQAKVTCVANDQREHVRSLVFEGLDNGLVDRVEILYEVWVREPASQQPQRAQTGLDHAISAYLRGRADAEKWNPPAC